MWCDYKEAYFTYLNQEASRIKGPIWPYVTDVS